MWPRHGMTTAESLAAWGAYDRDDPFPECAIEAASDFIITADNHLLRLGQYEGIPIMRPQDFLKRAMIR